jgi:predicted transcriptional regulator
MASNRVNLSSTVRPEVKAKTEAIARRENNTTSRIVENALLDFIHQYEATHPDVDLLSNKSSTPHA